MNGSLLRAAIVDSDAHQDVVDTGLGVFDLDIEIAVVFEQPGIDELVFRLPDAAAPALLDQAAVRKFGLRVFVEGLQIGMGRSGVEVVVQLLDVLAMVPFTVGEAEQALLQNGVSRIPHGQRKA